MTDQQPTPMSGSEPPAPTGQGGGPTGATGDAGAPPAQPAAGGTTTPPPPTTPVSEPTPPTSGGGNGTLIAAGAIVVVVILALIALSQLGGGGSTATPSPSAATSPSPSGEASPSAETSPSAEASPSGTPAASLASQMILGGPPECPQRPYCIPGLKDVYGITFKEFKPLDAGGPITVAAVKSGQVDVGVLFTSDPSIVVNDFVLLADDKHLQKADNLVPIVRNALLEKAPGIAELINPWMAKLTQEELTKLNKAVAVDKQDTKTVVADWLKANGLTTGSSGTGITVTVGSTNFYEQEILGEMFAQILEANGFTVDRKFQLGNREIVFPALKDGQIDMLPEYAATLLEYVNNGAGEATSDPATTVAKLEERLAPLGLTALDYAPATDQNGFVVTRDTANKYRLTKLSDLAQPAP